MASEPVVRCAECMTVLPEPPNTPLESRAPCPKCGSTARNVAITLGVAMELNVAMPIIARGGKSAPADRQLDDAGFDTSWLRLSDDGAWMVRVYDREGTFIDGAIADDPEEAILAVIERLLPPSEPAD